MDAPHADGAAARAYTLGVLTRLADPVLVALSENQLKARMPVEGNPDRAEFTHLEALGRLLAGIAPWLELGPDATKEGKLRERYIQLSVQAIRNAVDPKSPDYLNFRRGSQPLYDAGLLAQGLLRAPQQLWRNLDEKTRRNLITVFGSVRKIQPHRNNWLLAKAMVEAAVMKFTGINYLASIETAVTQFMAWHVGDGMYGDGPDFHWDYYNSFAIQPMLLDVVQVCAGRKHPLGKLYPMLLERTRRHAAVLERMISPEGTFPVIGRSSCYRFGAFHALCQMAWHHQLSPSLSPGGVRAALTAVIRRMVEAPGTFDENGWLRIGVVGCQPALAEFYISTGSLYLCAVGLLHLGLPVDDPFWTEPDQPWTQQKIWSGENIRADVAYRDANPYSGAGVLIRFMAELKDLLRRAIRRMS